MIKQAQKKTSSSDKKACDASPNMNAWFNTCSKNIDALSQASRMSAEVFQGLARLQSEYMKQMMTDLGQISQDLMKPGNLKEKLHMHAPKARQNIDKTTDHAKNISKAIQDNAKNVSEIMQKRIQEAMRENRQHFEKMKQKTQNHDPKKHWSQWLHTSTATKN